MNETRDYESPALRNELCEVTLPTKLWLIIYSQLRGHDVAIQYQRSVEWSADEILRQVLVHAGAIDQQSDQEWKDLSSPSV